MQPLKIGRVKLHKVKLVGTIQRTCLLASLPRRHIVFAGCQRVVLNIEIALLFTVSPHENAGMVEPILCQRLQIFIEIKSAVEENPIMLARGDQERRLVTEEKIFRVLRMKRKRLAQSPLAGERFDHGPYRFSPLNDPETAFVIPVGITDVVPFEEHRHIPIPAVFIRSRRRLAATEFAAIDRQIVFFGHIQNLFEMPFDHVGIEDTPVPLYAIFLALRFGKSIQFLIQNGFARIMNRPGVIPYLVPGGPVVGQEKWLIIVESDNDIGVVFRNPQIFHGAVILPAVGTYKDFTLRLQLPQGRHGAANDFVPRLRVIGHRLIHQLVGDPLIRIFVQLSAQFLPAGIKFLLSFRVGKKRLNLAVKVVSTQNV